MTGLILAAISAMLLPGTLSHEGAILWLEGDSPAQIHHASLNGKPLSLPEGRTILLNGLTEDSVYSAVFYDKDGTCCEVSFRTPLAPVVIDIRDYGAVGDGRTDNTAAIQAAIDACPPHGEVLVPEGIYMTGALFILKDDFSMRICTRATLKAIPNPDLFPLTRNLYEGWEKDVYSSVLNIGQLHGSRHRSIRIFGGGTIDNGGDLLATLETERDGRMSRAHGLPIIRCEDVSIENITVRNPCTWNIHPLLCDGFTTYACRLESAGFGLSNADGWDPDSSTKCFLIDSVLDGQDDNVAIKSVVFSHEDGKMARPSEFIRIYNCHFLQGGGLVVGAELPAGANDIIFEKCVVDRCDRGIHVCTRPLGRGDICDIHFRDIEIGYAGCWGINVTLWYWIQNYIAGEHSMDDQLYTHDITFDNIHIGYAAGNPIQVLGTVSRPVRFVSFTNVRIDFSQYDILLRNCDNISIKNCSLGENYLVTENSGEIYIDRDCKKPQSPWKMVDPDATYPTIALYSKLHEVASSGRFLLGVQDATASGYGWNDDSGVSDIERLTGEKPEVYCWDFMDVVAADGTLRPDADKIRRLACRAYYEGGINSFCWHMDNLTTGGNFYSLSKGAVRDILPGGPQNERFNILLTTAADFIKSLIGKDGSLMPIIFRPWHEFDGDWFWWGRKCRTNDELKELYSYTVSYMRDTLGVHNLLWCFSPDINFTSEKEYLACYPGDDCVDILGLDNYWLYRPEVKGVKEAALRIQVISDYAIKTGKVAALTETGQGGIPEHDWFTAKLLPSIYGQEKPSRLAYVAFWRNSVKGYFTPYSGHPAEDDFRRFLNDERVITLWKYDWLGQYYHLSPL